VNRTRLAALVVALVATAGPGSLGGCSRGPRRPNIAIVVLDTVRRDYTGVGAAEAGRVSATPSLDALAAEGTVFSNTWANAPWTVPSHASMFTGVLPSVHGCHGHNFLFETDRPTLAELLDAAGYETVAFFSNPWLTDRLTGMLRGFKERYAETGVGTEILNRGGQGGPETISNIRTWLSQRRGDRPFLVFVNFLEAHLPYDPPLSYREAHLADLPFDDAVETEWAHEFNAGLHREEVDWNRIRRLYAGDVATADGLLGEFLQLLADYRVYDDTVVIVTSDHGENLGDHGLMDHQFGLFDTLIRVPLVVRAPGRLPPGMREDPAMLTDIYATALDLAGVEEQPETPNSRSLVGPPARPDRPLIAEYRGANSALISHLVGLNPKVDVERLETAYVRIRMGGLELTMGSDGTEELYDLVADPARERNLAAERVGTVNALLELTPFVGRMETETEIEIDEETRSLLRSLGYVR